MRAWEKYIRKVEPYVPGEQPKDRNIVKLNTNENPYPPAPKVEKILEEFNAKELKYYPSATVEKLVEKLADYYHVNENQVFTGVGSDDVLGMAFLTFFNSDKPILFPDITYSFYKVWADLFRIPYECPKLSDDFRIRKEDYYKENGGIVIANPNAPTSIYEPVEFIRDILIHNQESIVIVDEAYIDFAGESALPLIQEFENLLVVQTYSKSRSLAGIRIGYAIGNERLIKAINDVKYSYNSYTMNMTAIECGAAALEEKDYYRSITEKIILTRQAAKIKLEQLGFTCLDSGTNFLFATHRFLEAKTIFDELRAKNIFVRHFDSKRINNYLRITIGTEEEMKKLYDALNEILIRYDKNEGANC